MIRRVALAALILAVAGSLSVADAQGRGHGKNKHKGKHKNKHHVSQGIPPGHLPRAGECRVWYEGRPPGHQPAPTSCTEARAIAAGDSDARVIYGDRDRDDRKGRDRDDDDDDDRDDDDRDKRWRDRRDGVLGGILGDRSDRERADRDRVERDRREREAESRRPRGGTAPRDETQVRNDNDAPFRNGHNDGYREGLTDGRARVPRNPTRFSRYRTATRGYRTTYGSRAQYQEWYRDGFRAGYDTGYSESSGRD